MFEFFITLAVEAYICVPNEDSQKGIASVINNYNVTNRISTPTLIRLMNLLFRRTGLLKWLIKSSSSLIS